MRQSRKESLVEAFTNVASGFLVAMLVNWLVIIPLWGLPWTIWDNLGVTAIFTATAVLRGYFWRRFFNAGLHRAVHGWLS